jgi:hypothetical protein
MTEIVAATGAVLTSLAVTIGTTAAILWGLGRRIRRRL